jgi:hypothetical protein
VAHCTTTVSAVAREPNLEQLAHGLSEGADGIALAVA